LSTTPLKLISQTDEINQSIIEELEKALEDAKSGRITGVLILARTPGSWMEYRSGTSNFPEMIGQFEIAKMSWILQYMQNTQEVK
jgi:hypothetical protein